jgi:hypothetical protein
MIRDAFLVYDEALSNGVIEHTSDAFVERLGVHDKIALQVVVDNTTGPANGALTVACEHSGDGEHWVAKSAVPEINATTIVLNATSYGEGYVYSMPNLPFVRFSILLTGSLTAAHVKLYVTARDPSG